MLNVLKNEQAVLDLTELDNMFDKFETLEFRVYD